MSTPLPERPIIPLPSGFTWGLVKARSIHAMADTTADTDRFPEARGSQGRVTFTPRTRFGRHETAPTAFVQFETVNARFENGVMIDAEGEEGIWLISGAYNVSFQIEGGSIPSFPIVVTEDHDEANPLDLVVESPEVVPPGYTEIVRVSDRIRAEEAADRSETALRTTQDLESDVRGYAERASQVSDQIDTFETLASKIENDYLPRSESAATRAEQAYSDVQGFSDQSGANATRAENAANSASSSWDSVRGTYEEIQELIDSLVDDGLPLATTGSHGLMSSQDKAKLDGATSSNNSNSVVSRNSAGNFNISDPVSALHAANKRYVDAKAIESTNFNSNTNLNDLRSAGRYFKNLTASGTTANNFPTTTAGAATMEVRTAGTVVIQEFTLRTGLGASVHYVRTSNSSANWSAWEKTIKQSDLDAVGSSSNNSTSDGQLVRRDAEGYIHLKTATQPTHPVRKLDFDNAIAPLTNATPSVVPGALVSRWSEKGSFNAPDPESHLQVANKRYVDGLVTAPGTMGNPYAIDRTTDLNTQTDVGYYSKTGVSASTEESNGPLIGLQHTAVMHVMRSHPLLRVQRYMARVSSLGNQVVTWERSLHITDGSQSPWVKLIAETDLDSIYSVDNTLGKKVTVGGEVVKYDSGWRDFSTYLASGVTGQMHYRRTLENLYIRFVELGLPQTGAGRYQVASGIPTQWRGDMRDSFVMTQTDSSSRLAHFSILDRQIINFLGVSIPEIGELSTERPLSISGTAVLYTDQGVPTTLPGDPL